MEHWKISYHTIGVFVAFLILIAETIFLILKRDKTTPTYWLIGVFIGFSVMLLGYVLAYSIYHPIGAFHRYLTVFVVFGNASFTGFAYYFPKNIHPQESKLMIPFAFVVASLGYLHFIFNTWSMEKIYNFDAHFYTFDYGAQTALVILFLFILPLAILIRKTIFFSDYSGFLETWRKSQNPFKRYIAQVFIPSIKLFFPKGKDAQNSQSFAIVIFLLMITAVTNALNKIGFLSYDHYAFYYSNSTLIICFLMLITYINSSGEPTTFMVKLVGISLAMVMLVIGYISNITLNLSEKDYNNQKIAVINANKKYIINKEFDKLPEDIFYVVRKSKELNIFERNLELYFSKNQDLLNQKVLSASESKYKERLLKEIITTIKENQPNLNETELYTKAITIYTKSKQYQNMLKELEKENSRNYRELDMHYTSFDFIHENYRYEVGFSYIDYRNHIHETGLQLFWLSLLVPMFILLTFPRFFQTSLIEPLQSLLNGMHKVNLGDLNVNVPIKIQDEIGFITHTFNNMLQSIREAREELKKYANTLEEKVMERTKELKARMQEIENLKIQQDGDYFLTSLLTKPLSCNENKSELVLTHFILKQKKEFEFRKRKAELGGDLCIIANIKLGKQEQKRNYIIALNADAMGKSMQGAGGAIVMGVVMHSILSRYSKNPKLQDTTPEKWMQETYIEFNSIFKSFNETMVISAVLALIDELSGEMWYWNAEHPFPILYRDNKASFIENSISLRKIGLDVDHSFEVKKFKLLPGDTIFIGSDGKDDIDLTPNEEIRTINDDETLFLKIVEQANADLEKIMELLIYKGEITDDLSIIKIDFHHIKGNILEEHSTPAIVFHTEEMAALPEENPYEPNYYEHAKDLYLQGKVEESLKILKKGFEMNKTNSKLCKLLGLVAFKEKDYYSAMLGFKEYLQNKKEKSELWYFLSISYKKLGQIQDAIQAALRHEEYYPHDVRNLLHLAELYRLVGKKELSQRFANKALNLNTSEPTARKILHYWKKLEN